VYLFLKSGRPALLDSTLDSARETSSCVKCVCLIFTNYNHIPLKLKRLRRNVTSDIDYWSQPLFWFQVLSHWFPHLYGYLWNSLGLLSRRETLIRGEYKYCARFHLRWKTDDHNASQTKRFLELFNHSLYRPYDERGTNFVLDLHNIVPQVKVQRVCSFELDTSVVSIHIRSRGIGNTSAPLPQRSYKNQPRKVLKGRVVAQHNIWVCEDWCKPRLHRADFLVDRQELLWWQLFSGGL